MTGQSGSAVAIPARRKFIYGLVLIFLLAGAAEIVGQVLLSGREITNRYLAEAYYRKREWSAEFFKQQAELRLRYEPYVGWRRKDCRSKYLNVIDGERLTVHPSEPSAEAVRVWCFGGSTMWGEGVRDAYTIPSHLARIAADAGLDVSFRNLGESGWVSTQEALYLLLLLRRGERPDVVLFYDGVNDVFSTYQTGRADGSPQNREIFENYFDLGYDPRRRFHKKIALYRMAQRLVMNVSDAWEPVVGRKISADAAAAQTVGCYARTVDLVRKFAADYGVEAAFFWQPVISFQPNYRTAERDAWRNGNEEKLEGVVEFYELATSRFDVPGVVNLSRCLGPSPPEGYFVDHNHLNEEGNAVAARAIFEHVRPLIEKRMHHVGRKDGLN